MKDFSSIDWVDAFARLHPVLLHLPIGLLVALAWLNCWSFIKRSRDGAQAARSALVFLLVTITPLAATSGWLLHESASYPDPVELHEWFGIGLMVVSLSIGWAHYKNSKYYAPLLWLGFVLLFPTAHFGGTLTHGEGFLTEPWLEAEEPAEPEPTASVVEFEDVLPIFQARCDRCHGERKQRGGLDLHSLDALLIGGDTGLAIVMGSPQASPLLTRLRLPLDHEDHMPPSNKPQPTATELLWIEAWILGEPSPGEELAEVVPDVKDPEPSSALEHEEVIRALGTLRDRLAHVQPASANSDALWIDFTASELADGDLSALLSPLKNLVAELSLAGKSVTASDLSFVAELPALETIDLRRLAQENLDLTPLASSLSIRSLNLAGTSVPLSSTSVIAELASLELVYLWGTGLESEIADISKQRPELVIVGASPPPDEPLETEPDVKFEKAQPPEVAAVPLQAENTTCPVTDQPIDARFTVLFEGRAIGFCCPNCPKTFWDDPEEFLGKLSDK